MITPSLDEVWPDVERRLRALLYKRGLDQPSADDVVQEVALRVLDNGVTFDSPGDLLRWAAPVACRLHVDLLRQRARHTVADEAAEHPSRDDVAREVTERLELQRALRGIATLRPADRAAIMEAVANDTVPATRQEAVRLAVRRHRARHRLAVVLEHLAAAAAALRLLLRDRRSVALAALVPVAAVPFLVTLPERGAAEAATRPPAAAAVAPARPARPAQAAPAAPTATAVRRHDAVARPRPVARRVAEVPSTEREAVHLTAPRGVGLRAGTDERAEGDSVLCVTDVPVPPGIVCVL